MYLCIRSYFLTNPKGMQKSEIQWLHPLNLYKLTADRFI